ncbi:hypothetical protein HMPREF0322_03308 [Desulfitobacterium hafniense DP7]|uniref:Uncharacterized protein n=1 Tax=Desulfitobacterium hafniense DP7 TaxID=537010 RepID=G9XQR0_DESHA|nr:hypothetical protein HMPREF0322_03308 [Desulfitobacterium hafniense DP7]
MKPPPQWQGQGEGGQDAADQLACSVSGKNKGGSETDHVYPGPFFLQKKREKGKESHPGCPVDNADSRQGPKAVIMENSTKQEILKTAKGLFNMTCEKSSVLHRRGMNRLCASQKSIVFGRIF